MPIKSLGIPDCCKYFEVHINTDFLEVMPVVVPIPDFSELSIHLAESASYRVLRKEHAAVLFRFRGMCIVTISDVTAEKAAKISKTSDWQERLKTIKPATSMLSSQLKTIIGNNKIEFDLFPLVTINNEACIWLYKRGTGILFEVWGDRLSLKLFRKQAKGYFSETLTLSSSPISSVKREIGITWLEHFRKLKVRSLALLPVFYNRQPVGVLAVHTWEDETFDEMTVSLLSEPALAAVGHLLQVYIDEVQSGNREYHSNT